MLKPVLEELVKVDGRNFNQLSVAYGIEKVKRGGEEPKRSDQYRNALIKIVEQPDKATWESLTIFLGVLGVDAEAALAIAINAATKAKAS
jgi:hypothetical protein